MPKTIVVPSHQVLKSSEMIVTASVVVPESQHQALLYHKLEYRESYYRHSTMHPSTCMVPSSAANELPTRPARMIAAPTGDSSRHRDSASTPPMERVRPRRANSRTNWMEGMGV